jgi:hypothetical protein
MKRYLLFTLFFLASGGVDAAFYSTEYLKGLIESCNSLPEIFDATPENFARIKDCGLSTGFILGVFDSLNAVSDRSLCLPGTIESEQVVATVGAWIQAHPERLQTGADDSVRAAVHEAWTCGQ